MAFEVIPDLLNRVELRRIGWALLPMQPGVGLLHGLDRRSPVNGAAVPQEDEVAAEMPQERPQEVGDIAPLAGLASAELAVVCPAVSPMVGRRRKTGSDAIFSTTSQPEIQGRSRSNTRTSGTARCSCLRASSALRAPLTRNPSFRKSHDKTSRVSSSSKATRIRVSIGKHVRVLGKSGVHAAMYKSDGAECPTIRSAH